MSYLYEERLSQVASAMRATGDERCELLVRILRRSAQEQWPKPWLIAALSQHVAEEQAEELAHQEAVYHEQSLLIAEHISVAERLGLNAYKEWRAQQTACVECRKFDNISGPIDSNFPTHSICVTVVWINTFFTYAHSFCERRLSFSFKKGNAVAWR